MKSFPMQIIFRALNISEKKKKNTRVDCDGSKS